MKLLAITYLHNEQQYLPYWIHYYRSHGCELFAINNESTDDTEQILQKNNVPFFNLDTEGAFDPDQLQSEAVNVANQVRPDWMITAGADLYFSPRSGTLYNTLRNATGDYFRSPVANFCNTGEQRTDDPFTTYRYYHRSHCILINRYHTGLTMMGDYVKGESLNEAKGKIWGFNYGNTKTKKEREETLARRRKYWEQGGHPTHGAHYIMGKQQDWTWDRDKLHKADPVGNANYKNLLSKVI